jgi:hypothetical protein
MAFLMNFDQLVKKYQLVKLENVFLMEEGPVVVIQIVNLEQEVQQEIVPDTEEAPVVQIVLIGLIQELGL